MRPELGQGGPGSPFGVVEPRLLFARLISACNEHDPDAAAALFSADIAIDGEAIGRNRIVGRLSALWRAFPDAHWEVLETISNGRRVAARMRFTGTQATPWLGVDRPGLVVDMTEFGFFRCQGGHIVEHWGSGDAPRMLAQLRSGTMAE
ncbi:ester cyclase [Schumannella sp. 10F1B-5-1]|uniref:ester cyclase n=1 Tax=Schumannella sp. 10F1B-5-1 TaxID=2590780 RepID=UPI00113253CA|nr:ester cyclase [Schumannella sp. 10F1B-5-1]TPW70825.1 ester cyclase [Schumannella sp. 10F1B-5-1]